MAIQHVDGHYHALPLTDVLRIHKRKYREPGKVEYGTAIYRCPVLLGQISVATRSLLSLAAMNDVYLNSLLPCLGDRHKFKEKKDKKCHPC